MGLRVVNALLYAVFAAVGLAALAPQVRPAFRAVTARWSYEPALVLPWLWLGLAGLLAVLLFLAARRLFDRRPVGRRLYVALLFASLTALAVRNSVPAARRVSADDAAAHLLARVEAAADRVHAAEGRYPTDPSVLAADLPPLLRDLGYWRRGGLPLTTRVHVLPDAEGPALRVPEGVRPGDVVFAVDPPRRRYWTTVFALDAHGRVGPATDPGGRVRLAAGLDGRATSRLDPLFPEYPRRHLPSRRPEASPRAP